VVLGLCSSVLAMAEPVAGQDGETGPPAGSGVEVAPDRVEAAPVLTGRPEEAPKVVPPEPGVVEVVVSGEPGLVSVGNLPVRVGPAPAETAELPTGESGSAAGARLVVEVLDGADRERMGAQGIAFRVARADGGVEDLRVEVEVDYSALVGAGGGGWADRLQLVDFARCGVQDGSGCAEALGFTNDRSTNRIRAVVTVPGVARKQPVEDASDDGSERSGASTDPMVAQDDPVSVEGSTTTTAPVVVAQEDSDPDPLPTTSTTSTSTPWVDDSPSSGGPGVGGEDEGAVSGSPDPMLSESPGTFGLLAGTSGPLGTYEASDLSPYGEWSTGLSAGAFSWSYPLPDASHPAGTASVGGFALSYSAQAVDAMTGAVNAQTGWEGLGWQLEGAGFIERRYRACGADGLSGAQAQDLCYVSDNATLSFGGVTSELVPTGTANVFRLERDQRWRIQRSTGSANGVHDGEYWVLTRPDGWRYWFGLGAIPNTSPLQLTGSAWGVRVRGNNSGEPCFGNTNGCDLGWRWNLDRIEDPAGNVTTLLWQPETNKYGFAGSTTNLVTYTRGGYLLEARTTQRAWSEATYGSRWRFTSDWRCLQITGCPAPAPSNASSYPDVPVDLICTAAPCSTLSPTFFTGRRLTGVVTELRQGASWVPVDEVRLVHALADNGWNERMLWLESIQRIGWGGTGGSTALPAVQMWPVGMANRVDSNPSAGVTPKVMNRVQWITNELGGRIAVSYGQPHPCSPIPVGSWDTNTKDCFPAWTDLGSGAGWGAFHKYLVTQVDEIDLVGGSPTVTTAYTYEDTPAFRHAEDSITPGSQQSWTDYRGHGTVLVTKNPSGPAGSRTVTRHRYFRGMHGDRFANNSLKVVPVAAFDLSAQGYDENWFAGWELDRQSLAGGVEQSGHMAWPLKVDIALQPSQASRWVGVDFEVDRIREGGTTRKARRDYVYNSTTLLPSAIGERGDQAVAGDERCRSISYVPNTSLHLLDLPYQERTWDGYSTTTRSCTGVELARFETNYQGVSWGQVPTNPRADEQRTLLSAPSAWATTMTGYDGLGRVTSSQDARGAVTTTAYSPPSGLVSTQVVENALGHEITTTLDPARQVPVMVRDSNLHDTTLTYDRLGRLETVLRPGDSATYPTLRFVYDVHPFQLQPAAVRRSQRTTSGTSSQLDSWTFLDGLGRTRQTQHASPSGGRVISTTTYDARGLLAQTTLPYWATGAAGSGLDSSTTASNFTQVAYDQLERPVTETFYAAGGTQARWSTATTYDGTSTIVTPPVGGATRTRSDLYGRRVGIDEFNGPATGWPDAITTYGYDDLDRLVDITDAAGNVISYTYDMASRRVGMDDPDAGAWGYEYDANGNQTRVVDADPSTADLHLVYDDLDRLVERWVGDPANGGARTASWTYDAPGEVGLLDRSVRHDPSYGDFILDVTGYDDRARPTGRSWQIPSGLTAMAGTYELGYAYDAADRPVSVSYPALGGLPAEMVTTGYHVTGAPVSLTGAEGYVTATGLDSVGRVATRTLGSGGGAVTRTYTYDGDQRLTGWAATTATGTIQDDRVSFDAVGNVTARWDARVGIDQRECFGYDPRNRLVSAYTTTNPGCGAATATGPAPYQHAYGYLPDGRLASRDEGAGPLTYTYGTSTISGVVPLRGDWDGDGDHTIGLFLPGPNTFLGRNDNLPGPPQFSFTFGTAGDQPIVGDWDGDGDDTIGVYRPSTRGFYARNTLSGGAADLSVSAFGTYGDKPIIGDWDGDGDDSIGVYRPNSGGFYARNSFTGGTAELSVGLFGAVGDTPIIGDWDGDGDDTIGVHRPSNGRFYARNSFTGGTAQLDAYYGTPTDTPLTGDWDGDGDDTLGAHRPATSTYYLRNSYSNGPADITTTFFAPGTIDQPHAVTTVGPDTYAHDPNGQLTSRPGTSSQQALSWDSEHRLAGVDEGSDNTSFVYDPDGQRLLRQTPTDTTLYLEGHELTLTGSTVTTKRYYTLGNTVVAVRDSAGSGSLNYLLGDQLGSTTTAVNASTGATQTQRFLPFGAPRSGGVTATDRGWIGQTKDASTGLQYLNARYYDPTIGRFTATDPIIDTAQPGSLDRYGYGYDNPVTLSDPTGLYVELENRGSVSLAWQSKLASIGAAPKPVTGRYHARWPSRRGVPNAPEPRPTEPGITPFGRDTGSVRLDGNRYPVPRRASESMTDQSEALVDRGLELVDRAASPSGTCSGAQAILGGGVTVGICRGTVGGDAGSVVFGGPGAGLEGLTLSSGVFYTNADNWGQIGGGSGCASLGSAAGGAGGSVTACASTSDLSVLVVVVSGEVGPSSLLTYSFFDTYGVTLGVDPVQAAGNWWTDITQSFFHPFVGGSG